MDRVGHWKGFIGVSRGRDNFTELLCLGVVDSKRLNEKTVKVI